MFIDTLISMATTNKHIAEKNITGTWVMRMCIRYPAR